MLEDVQISDTNLLTHPSSQCSAVTGSLYGEGALNPCDFATAVTYYKQAATFWPSSDNPHHQLAILASYSGDDQVEAARTAVINQEIKHILKDVLLTKMKISSMARFYDMKVEPGTWSCVSD
ncbi:SMG7-like protein [Tanacetum coccineum]